MKNEELHERLQNGLKIWTYQWTSACYLIREDKCLKECCNKLSKDRKNYSLFQKKRKEKGRESLFFVGNMIIATYSLLIFVFFCWNPPFPDFVLEIFQRFLKPYFCNLIIVFMKFSLVQTVSANSQFYSHLNLSTQKVSSLIFS